MFDLITPEQHSDSVAGKIAWVRQKAFQAKQHLERSTAETPVQLFLPGMGEFVRAMPNHIARSSLFSPVARGPKKVYVEALLESRDDAEIKFWGEQLDEAQADVWMQAIHEASRIPLGKEVVINRASFLRSIGRDTGKSQYEWFHRTMLALNFAMITFSLTQDRRKMAIIEDTDALHLVDHLRFDRRAETYSFEIDTRWNKMFCNREFALIDWRKRLLFGRSQDMAKALQRLNASSSDLVQRHRLDRLRAKLCYGSPIRKFREALHAAMRELERLEVIAGGRIELSSRKNEQVVWINLKSSA